MVSGKVSAGDHAQLTHTQILFKFATSAVSDSSDAQALISSSCWCRCSSFVVRGRIANDGC